METSADATVTISREEHERLLRAYAEGAEKDRKIKMLELERDLYRERLRRTGLRDSENGPE